VCSAKTWCGWERQAAGEGGEVAVAVVVRVKGVRDRDVLLGGQKRRNGYEGSRLWEGGLVCL
jgi:hypothetical protein